MPPSLFGKPHPAIAFIILLLLEQLVDVAALCKASTLRVKVNPVRQFGKNGRRRSAHIKFITVPSEVYDPVAIIKVRSEIIL